MIRSLKAWLLGAVSLSMLAALASAQSVPQQSARDIRIYTPGEISMSQIEVVGRPWVDTWRSAFWLPTFATEEQAVEALKVEAARRGADGLANVNCLDQGRWQWSSSKEPAILCYGIAIRVRPG